MNVKRDCEWIVPAYFDEYENPIGCVCELLDAAESKLVWMEIEDGRRAMPEPPSSKPIPVG